MSTEVKPPEARNPEAKKPILVVEDNAAERDFAQAALEDHGYRVVAAANAAAAATMPDARNVGLIVMSSRLMGVDGFEATRMLRQQADTNPIPILLLIPEETVERNQDLSPRGANGFLLKPYSSKDLARRVGRMLEQQHLDDLAAQYLSNSADQMMKSLAERHVKSAVDRKTQIIIERCIQNVATAVDQRARQQVSESVTALTAEKEQELVKFTVREVAQSMVEKLAERKVTEAMETVLAEQAERTVKRIADQLLPTAIRERLKDTLNNTLPREIQTRVQRHVEKEAPEIAKQLFGTVEEATNKVVPRVVREMAPEIIEREFKRYREDQIPKQVREIVSRELDAMMATKMAPTIKDAAAKLRKYVITWNIIMAAIVAGVLAVTVYINFFMEK